MKPTSVLILAAVPAVLGIGAIYWLTFGEGLHSFDRQMATESRADQQIKRRAEIVKAVPLPAAPLKIILSQKANATIRITRAEVDNGSGTIYWEHFGHLHECYLELHIKALAPDGTTISGDEKYTDDPDGGTDRGDKGELSFTYPADDRTAVVKLSLSYQDACR